MRVEHAFPTSGNEAVLYLDNLTGSYYRWVSDAGYVRVADKDLEALGIQPTPVICYYHKNCYDGTASAAVVLKARPECKLIAIDYKDPIDIESMRGAVVYVVDFSFPEEVIHDILGAAKRLVILDHHRTFRDTAQRLQMMNDSGSFGADILEIVYDESRSGALITWEYFFPDHPAPRLVQHVSDRDLWRFQIPYTRQVTMALGMYPHDPKTYLDVIQLCEDDSIYERLKLEGTVLTVKLEQDVRNVIDTTLRFVKFAGRDIPLVNCQRALASEVLSRLAAEHEVAVSYYDERAGRVYSVRSVGDTGEAKKLAERFGGGGHPNAAGWRTSHITPFEEGNLASYEISQVVDELRQQIDSVYEERNYVVAALSRAFPSGTRPTSIPGWDPAWNECVYIDLPSGQISYHYHTKMAGLFKDLPAYTKPYDGHRKIDVHDRLSALGVGPYRRYLEDYIAEHRAIARSANPELRPDEIRNLVMWCEKLEKFIQSVQLAYETGTHPKEYWN